MEARELMHKLRLNEKDSIILLDKLETEVKKLTRFRDIMENMNNCNNCSNTECGIKPSPGEWIRYNCHLYKKGDD